MLCYDLEGNEKSVKRAFKCKKARRLGIYCSFILTSQVWTKLTEILIITHYKNLIVEFYTMININTNHHVKYCTYCKRNLWIFFFF